jgi:hypothetical protein
MFRLACALGLVVLIALPFTQPFAAVDTGDLSRARPADPHPSIVAPATVASQDADPGAMSDWASRRIVSESHTAPGLKRLCHTSGDGLGSGWSAAGEVARSPGTTVLRI